MAQKIWLYTAKPEVYIILGGTGDFLIHWDNRTNEEGTLFEDATFGFLQTYHCRATRSICIEGNVTILIANSNELTNIDICHNPKLRILSAHSNRLGSIDICNNAALTVVDIHSNHFSAASLTNLFKALPDNINQENHHLPTSSLDDLFNYHPAENNERIICIEDNPGLKGCNKTIISEKGWKHPYQNSCHELFKRFIPVTK